MKNLVSVAVIVVILGAVGIGIFFATNSIDSILKTVESKKEFDASQIHHIKVETSSAHVNVLPTKEEKIIVDFHGKGTDNSLNKEKLHAEQKEDTLNISVDSSFSIGISYKSVTVDVYIPNKLLETVHLETSSADINVKDLHANIVELETSSGDVTVKNLNQTQTGFMMNDTSTKKISVYTSSADIDMQNVQTGDFEAETSSGDIHVADVSSSPSQPMKLTSKSGDVEGTNLKGDISAITSSGDITLTLPSIEQNISAETSSGDVEINANKINFLVVDFTASSGDGVIDDEFKLTPLKQPENEIHGRIGTVGDYYLNVKTRSGNFDIVKN